MRRLMAVGLVCLMIMMLSACGASQESLDAMYGRYETLRQAYETFGSSLYNLGFTADSELGLSYAEWGEAITGLANEINENANRMSEEDVGAVVSQIDEMLPTLEKTQKELDDMLAILDVSGRWSYADESGNYICFSEGEAKFYDTEENLIESGTYTQNGIYVELKTVDAVYSGVTDGSTIVFGEGEDAFSVRFEGFVK